MGFLHKFCVNVKNLDLSTGMVQANDVARPMSRHSERTPLVLGGTQLHGKPECTFACTTKRRLHGLVVWVPNLQSESPWFNSFCLTT